LKEILFVCTGNTCRSPMAAGLFKHAVSSDPRLSSLYTAASAGISAASGLPASENALAALHDCFNIDISSHKSSPVTCSAIDRAYLVLTMTASQKDFLHSMFPEYKEKIYSLTEYAHKGQNSGSQADIADPFGRPLSVYIDCAAQINSAILALLELF
jgi:protein-tyrosine phosphatase